MSRSHRALIDAWTLFKKDKPPYLLKDDEQILDSFRKRRLSITHDSYESYVMGDDFNARDSGLLHTGLLPIPYLGDLQQANIFILMLNPGLGHHDYFAEENNQPYRKALIRNLRQQLDKRYPMPFLNPAFSWHGGGQYWISRLKPFIEDIVKKKKCTFGEAMEVVSRSVCCLELVPYHSTSFKIPRSVLNALKSKILIRNFVHNDLLKRAKKNSACIIVARGNRHWGVPSGLRNVSILSPSEARRANLSIDSQAGKLIEEFLKYGVIHKSHSIRTD
jgi:hypothetical protein